MTSIISDFILFLYELIERIIIAVFAPPLPGKHQKLKSPHVAVIGTGLTGVSAAAHCVGHGCRVTMFEARSRDDLGGIWARVNKTSGLQIHSIMYRFHPAVKFSEGYPKKDEIVSQIRSIWDAYGLEKSTRFETPVKSVRKLGDKWMLNGDAETLFDGVIAAVGTCGDPKMPKMPGLENFEGKVVHSSQLDGVDVEGKTVAIIGGGASAVEALEYVAAKGAKKTNILSRSDKWIIPRNPLIDVLLSLNIFGYEIYLSYIPERLLRLFFYRDLKDLAPAPGHGLWESTPMLNNNVLEMVRNGTASWLRGDIKQFKPDSISFVKREQGTTKGDPGTDLELHTDIVIMATGFERPTLNFLPVECFEKPYDPPNWFIQTFPPGYPSITAPNATYRDAIGTVGHFHIGIYTRLLIMFLWDPLTRPSAGAMKLWIDMTRAIKRFSPTPAFDFFTYGELCYWFVFCVMINPFRWKWALFVLLGWDAVLPEFVIRKESKIWGYDKITETF